MTFQALLVSKDDDAIAVLKPVLTGFGLTVDNCSYADALARLTEQKFDSILVDFDDPHSAALVLQNAHQAGAGRHAVVVALISDRSKVRNAFGEGANFVLYKPISSQQAQASLRAATALIKRERRRSYRVPVQMPVQLSLQNGPGLEGILLDLSEEGMDVLAAQALYPSANISFRFTLPDGKTEVDARGEVAWANPNGQSGVRFVNLSENLRASLKEWVAANAPELPPDEPEPLSQCKLTDLSLGGCYVETESPFPERSRIVLCLKAGDMEVENEGIVRVMHPGFGMGVEFPSRTAEQREQVESFIECLTSQPGATPELSILPRALTVGKGQDSQSSESGEMEDALLELLRTGQNLSQEDFLAQLREQRGSAAAAS